MIKVYYNEPEEAEVTEDELKDINPEALEMLSDNKGDD